MKTRTKSTLLLTIFMVTVFIAPNIAVVKADTANSGFWNLTQDSFSNEDLAGIAGNLGSGIGQISSVFGNLGPAGEAMAALLTVLGNNLGDLSGLNMLDNSYVLSGEAQVSEEYTQNYGTGQTQTYWLDSSVYQTSTPGSQRYAYATITRSGTLTVNYTSGAYITFIMWDSDNSLINTMQMIIDAVQNVQTAIEALPEDPNTWTEQQAADIYSIVINEVLSTVTYLLFHINDIITGDELIIMNMITTETFNVTVSSDYAVDVNVYEKVDSGSFVDITTPYASDWLSEAQSNTDAYTEWVLGGAESYSVGDSKTWSTFSFNLIEIWLKNFEIHINASAIANMLVYSITDGAQGEEPTDASLAKVFQGMNIDIYVMTHSLAGFAAYDDINDNGVPDATYEPITYEIDGVEQQGEVITGSELEYYFALGQVGAINFEAPHKVTNADDSEGIGWGITFTPIELLAVPIGMNPGDVSYGADQLSTMSMGFTFTPTFDVEVDTTGYTDLSSTADTVVVGGKGQVKLVQEFGEWATINPLLSGLDFAVLFLSFMIHFELDMTVEDPSQDLFAKALEENDGILSQENYDEVGTVKVGQETGDLPVAEIDIAGPEYQQFNSTTLVYDNFKADTTIVPLALLNYNFGSEVSYVDSANPNESYSVNTYITIEASALLYAVSYRHFDGNGEHIVHDPTFSVFMTWDSPGFWAVILVIGSITLVAVAAIMITKRKNARL